MKLLEIKTDFQINVGAPEPIILSNESKLILAFYIDRVNSEKEEEEIILLNFKKFLKYRSGMPGNETISGHPYYKLGMDSFSFYELIDSDLIQELQSIASVHPNHNPNSWSNVHHYILTFHDSMFECVAEGFEIIEGNDSFYQLAIDILNESSVYRF